MEKEIFQLNKISKEYGKMRALSSLSLTIKKGELIALIGSSGAGKTTLLNILSGNLDPSHGDIFLDNKAMDSYKKDKTLYKKIGIIRQEYDLIEEISVINNVLAGRLGEWSFFKSLISLIFPVDKKMAFDALERVGISEKTYEKTSYLSGGQKQRVALARLLVQKPEIILADEPVSSLDPQRSIDLLSMLVDLVKEEGQTLIASLHSVEYAMKYFTRIIALKDGKIYFDAKPEDISKDMLQSLYRLKENEDDIK